MAKPKVTIIDGNNEIELSTIEDNIKAFMVKGEPGSDGVSPTASVSKVDDTTTIIITDKNGTTEADVVDGFDPTVTAARTDNVTTLTITDIDGTRTAEIYDGIDNTGGVPTDGVIGWDNDDIFYTCDGTESGDYYFTYNSIDYYFTMPTVEDGDMLFFDTTNLTLSLNGTTISTSSSGTGTELTFVEYIPNGYEKENNGIATQTDLTNKQDTLVSGTNIKTINNTSLLGSGNINISGANVNDSYSTSTTEPYSANYVNSQFDVISRTINFGSLNADYDKYDQTSTVSIPSGYEAVGILGYSLSGGYFTWVNISRLYISGTTVYWSISNPSSHDTGTITCDVKILVRKTN